MTSDWIKIASSLNGSSMGAQSNTSVASQTNFHTQLILLSSLISISRSFIISHHQYLLLLLLLRPPAALRPLILSVVSAYISSMVDVFAQWQVSCEHMEGMGESHDCIMIISCDKSAVFRVVYYSSFKQEIQLSETPRKCVISCLSYAPLQKR